MPKTSKVWLEQPHFAVAKRPLEMQLSKNLGLSISACMFLVVLFLTLWRMQYETSLFFTLLHDQCISALDGRNDTGTSS
jgi:hypothetical protein